MPIDLRASSCLFLATCVVLSSGQTPPRNLLRGASSSQVAITPISIPDDSTPIHLSISAFEDGDRCARTLRFAFENAKRPARLSFSILQARSQSSLDCVSSFAEKDVPSLCSGVLGSSYSSDAGGFGKSCEKSVMAQITSKVITPQEAAGPGHQRGLMKDMIKFDRPDKFCMQTDSHMDFLKDFDSLLIEDWMQTQNEFAVLTAYVLDMKQKGPYAMNMMVDCCGWTLENGIPRGNQCGDVPRLAKPKLTMNWAAGFSFHRCHAEQNAPVDPNLEWIFTGEEIDRAARLWTSGYDMYLPTRAFVLHDYGHSQQGFWSYAPRDEGERAEQSRAKLTHLLGLRGDSGEESTDAGHYYTLGTQRSLQQWKQFIKPALNQGSKLCTRDVHLQRVPVSDPTGLHASVGKPQPHEL